MLNCTSDNVNGYFWEDTIHHPKQIFLIIYNFILIYIYYYIDKAFDTNNGFEKHLLKKDFNTVSEPSMESFCCEYELHDLVKEKTCFKSIHNPSCIDLILANNTIAFHITMIVSPGLADFHKFVLTVSLK